MLFGVVISIHVSRVNIVIANRSSNQVNLQTAADVMHLSPRSANCTSVSLMPQITGEK